MSKAPARTQSQPWQIGELQPGDEVTLAEDCYRGGTMRPVKVPAGTRIKISWHARGMLANGKKGPPESTNVEIWDEWAEGYPTTSEERGPWALSSKSRIGSILRRAADMAPTDAGNAKGVDELDPLHRAQLVEGELLAAAPAPDDEWGSP